jgi:hypothetical protein
MKPVEKINRVKDDDDDAYNHEIRQETQLKRQRRSSRLKNDYYELCLCQKVAGL